MLPEEEFTYGVPNRPSTPIRDVISKLISKRLRKQSGKGKSDKVLQNARRSKQGEEARGQRHESQPVQTPNQQKTTSKSDHAAGDQGLQDERVPKRCAKGRYSQEQIMPRR